MNVNKIKRLSKQHADLVKFHRVCNCNEAELTVNNSETSLPGITLDYNTTRLILSDVRVSLLKRIGSTEEEIKKEATDGQG